MQAKRVSRQARRLQGRIYETRENEWKRVFLNPETRITTFSESRFGSRFGIRHNSSLFVGKIRISPCRQSSASEHCGNMAVRGKSPVEGAAGSCGCSARSEEDGDPGDLLRRTTKPTSANVRRPKGYAPLPVNGTEGAAPCSWNDQALLHRAPARNAARVTFTTGCRHRLHECIASPRNLRWPAGLAKWRVAAFLGGVARHGAAMARHGRHIAPEPVSQLPSAVPVALRAAPAAVNANQPC